MTACGSVAPSAQPGAGGMGGAFDEAGAPSLAGASAGTSSAGSAGSAGLDAAGAPGGSEDAGAGGDSEPGCADLLQGMPASKWVFADAMGALHYQALDARGDHIVDFSYAGYRAGGVALPEIAAVSELLPSGGDDTARIQAALDAVSARIASAGVRGAVALGPGTFEVLGTLHIAASGVVLRGAGSGIGGTVIALSGGPHLFLSVLGSGSWMTSNTAHVSDRKPGLVWGRCYTPIGASLGFPAID